MAAFIKVIILFLALFLIFFPLIPIRTKRKRFNTIVSLRYEKPHTYLNAVFILVAVLEIVGMILLYNLFKSAGNAIAGIPLIGSFLSAVIAKLGSDVTFIAFAITLLLADVLMIYLYVFLKTVVKKIMDSHVYENEEQTQDGQEKSKRQGKKRGKQKGAEGLPLREEDKKKPLFAENVPTLKHIRKKSSKNEKGKDTEKAPETREANIFMRAFFEDPEYLYAKPWVRRFVTILQCFIYLADIFFFLLLTLIFVSALFPVSNGVYNFLLNVMRVQDWYVYPFLSLFVLQEICNTFKTGVRPNVKQIKLQKTPEEETEENKVALRALASELKRYFDQDHKLRFYPGGEVKDTKFEYQFTNSQYRAALEYIRRRFHDKTGNKGQSYLECMDAMYNDEHVYFCGSFYSEIGEYIIAYTYTRLLSGARLIFIVNNRNKRNAVKKYILNRLIQMTGGSADVTWRVNTSDDRLDQADVLVASPEDFKDDDIVENNPDFFEEVCNAILIDADKVVSLESYLCPVLAIRLLNATADRVRFVFLSTDLIRGFAASSLPKLFCVEKVLSFSSANDNERVEYTLWNKESLKNRIYYKYGQKLMSLEGIIAEKAYQYGIDGVRVITSSPIDHGEREVLAEHNVEINEFYKDVPKINYMIYSDERCNLAASIYACTRFKGRRNSVSQIISKPYLLREYFMAKATKENFIKRSSFIQPRITEHAKKEKLSLLKIFCRASTKEGISVRQFISEMKNTIQLSHARGDVPLCKYCAEWVENHNREDLKANDDVWAHIDWDHIPLKDYAAYLIAALCDTTETESKDSYAARAKDYYLVVERINHSDYTLIKEKYIAFSRVREVFEKVFACNERVILRLNDTNIGYLDTFPPRVPLEYVIGQSIVYNNVEYEIEQISSDNKIIFLRRENVTYKNCLDTIFLRRYKIQSAEKIGQDGVLNNSKSMLREIRVSLQKVHFEGETYGFYTLMSNNQSLNFERGVEGNPHLDPEAVERNRRVFEDGRMLRVTLTTDMNCTDGMRMLCSAVFNEFIKTMFPMAYRCIAICPILEQPLEDREGEKSEEVQNSSDTEKIKRLYPYITKAGKDFTETDPQRMQFLFLNDCAEDVGVFDWFYDKLASNIQELLINTYSYLYWLKLCGDRRHYIYFGEETLPECFDLEGACELFAGYNITISDNGEQNYETANGDFADEETRCCSFCHKHMESGRYSFFDEKRTMFICADCMDTVGSEERLSELHSEIKRYLENNYPDITFGHADVEFAPESESFDVLNEWYFRIDPDKRKIIVGFDLPERNTKVAILLGMISFWQYDNDLMTEYSNAQLSYEELKLLDMLGETETAQWIRDHFDDARRGNVEEIEGIIANHESDGEDDRYTSFSAMRELGDKIRDLEDDIDYEDIEGEDYSDGLYDPNKTPRFWKRYLKNGALDESAEDGTEDDGLPEDDETSEDEDDSDDTSEGDEGDESDDVAEDDEEDENDEDDEEDEGEVFASMPKANSAIYIPLQPNCPPPTEDDEVSDLGEEKEEEPSNADEEEELSDTDDEEGPSDIDDQEEEPFDTDADEEEEPSDPDEEGEPSDTDADEEEEPSDAGEEEELSDTDEEGEPSDTDEEEPSNTDEEEPSNTDEEEEPSNTDEEEEPSDTDEEEPSNTDEEEEPSDTDEEEEPSDTDEEGEPSDTDDEEEGPSDAEDEEEEPSDNEDEEEEPSDIDDEEEPSDNEDEAEEPSDTDDEEEPSDTEEEEEDEEDDEEEEVIDKKEPPKKNKKDEKAKLAEKERRKKEKQLKKIQKGKLGLKIVPYESDEETNPSIRIYNEIVRHAYNFDESSFSREGVNDNRLHQIFYCVLGDYPELFWLYTYGRDQQSMNLFFRCKKPSGELDVDQISRKLAEIKKGAKFFTKGITKRTDPYKALITIYKRLILTLDYDGKGLEGKVDKDFTKDDRLRSLHGALVLHKSVCAGYAIAMQYLLQSVGIPCGYVTSEVKGSICHAFNIVKLGKYCYYLDATWGDASNTKEGDKYSDIVYFDYCCVPFNEFRKASKGNEHFHIPNHQYYPWFNSDLKANRHEYYRYRKAYLSRYNEDDLVRIFAYCAEHYNKKEDGRFCISFRCTGLELCCELVEKLRNPSTYQRIVEKAKRLIGKKKQATKLLDKQIDFYFVGGAPVVKIFYKKDEK